MAHHIYTTPGFILDSKPRGEAGKTLFIFTRELGLVLAIAQGVRLGVSKLRYHTQNFSYCICSLVRGKEMWRLTGATEADVVMPKQTLYVQVLALLRRLLHGEERNDVLFDTVLAFHAYLQSPDTPSDQSGLASVERIIVLRILHILGYVGNVAELEVFFTKGEWNSSLLAESEKLKSTMLFHINKGLQESQL